MEILEIILIITLAIALIHIVHALTLSRIIEFKEVRFSAPNIPSEMSGYRIAFVTDTHYISDARLRRVVEKLNRRNVDLVLLGGDFADKLQHMQKSVEILSHIRSTDGIFGVDGNHDVQTRLFAEMEEHGITPLSNSGVLVRKNFFLAGVEDLRKRNPDISKSVKKSNPEDFVLLISHNPDVTMKQSTASVDLMLCGHTHGGQITFFGIWAPIFTFTRHITEYGQRFRFGWAQSRDGTPVFVSRGTGEHMFRIFSRPQVVLLTLVRE